MKKYYKYIFSLMAGILFFVVGYWLFIKLFYYKFGRLPTPSFINIEGMDADYIQEAFFAIHLNTIEKTSFDKCRVLLATKIPRKFNDIDSALSRIGADLKLYKKLSDVTLYKFNSELFEGIVFKYKGGSFVDIELLRGDKQTFMSSLSRELGSIIEGQLEQKYPVINASLSFALDTGMHNRLRLTLIKYKIVDSSLYKCLPFGKALEFAKANKIPMGVYVFLENLRLATANIPALEGGVKVVIGRVYPAPFKLDRVSKSFLVVPINGTSKVYLIPAYVLLFDSRGDVQTRFGRAYIARQGRVVLPAITPDWYNK